MERISQIQADGYVINNGEHDEGIISFCAPIYDHTGQMVAGMSTGGIREIAARVGYDGLLAQTLEAARQVSQELGG